jgi:hypothetical protein
VENYFNYFTEIEEHFQKRRGSGLLLSTLDWALIETWKDAGIPMEAVLSGIDATFDKYDRRPSKTRKVNSLAYCSQEVLAAVEDMKEALVGAQRNETKAGTGMVADEVVEFLERNAATLSAIAESFPQGTQPGPVKSIAGECAASLVELAKTVGRGSAGLRVEDLERSLTAMEERLLAALTVSATESELAGLRAEADREIAPYRSKMPGFQLEQLRKQFVHKRLFEKATIPRLSLFYM